MAMCDDNTVVPVQDDPRTEELESRLNVEPQKPLSEAQFRKLRNLYFTVRHTLVKECGHKIDMINEPRHRNCEFCYWTWLSAHGELVQVADRALQEQGKAFLIKMRGRHFYEMFVRYMSTLARFKKEQDDKETGIAGEENRTIESAGGSRNDVPREGAG
jgi:hypothetical protein